MTPKPHDFRKPPALASALRTALSAWALQVSIQACRLWNAQLPFAVEMESVGVEVVPARAAMGLLPENALQFRVPIEGSDSSLLVCARPLMVSVLGGMLGPPPSVENLDQDLTPVEEDMVGFVTEQFFLAPIQKTWQLPQKLHLGSPARELASAEPPFPLDAVLVVAHFRARGPFGEADWWWMLPRQGGLFAQDGATAPAAPRRAEREAVVKDLPLKLTVRLGSARLSLLHLAALQAGDLLLLDQPIDKPLSVLLGGRVKFQVWPGARGPRQAVSIHAPVES